MCINRRQCLQHMTYATVGAALFTGCQTTPITGRRQLMLLPESQELSLGEESYREVTEQEPPSQNRRFVDMVQRVGDRIARESDRSDFDWEFRVIASPTQNAFCLPGGKVAVYEGILPVCENEAGLAVVMSHEVAHALARHGGERMSQSMAVDNTKRMVNQVFGKQDETKKELLMQAYGVATKYGVILPYSRKQESEADHIGLMLMAKAGYDPHEAPRFWNRFGQAGDGSKPPEFLSTHPSDARRSDDLRELLPEADGLYTEAAQKTGLGERIV